MKRSGFRRKGAGRRSSLAGLGSLALALALATGAGYMLQPSRRDIEGRAYAVDGDTLLLNDARIRLEGIDAPELHQTCSRDGQSYFCGEKARNALISLILGHSVQCRTSGRDRYGRPLGKCTANGVDLAARMVEEGWAVSYGRDYALEEAAAEVRAAGLWAGEFERPQEWRRRNPRSNY